MSFSLVVMFLEWLTPLNTSGDRGLGVWGGRKQAQLVHLPVSCLHLDTHQARVQRGWAFRGLQAWTSGGDFGQVSFPIDLFPIKRLSLPRGELHCRITQTHRSYMKPCLKIWAHPNCSSNAYFKACFNFVFKCKNTTENEQGKCFKKCTV